MPVIIKDARTFTADRAWGARDLAEIDGATVRLHWTDQPYQWHVNDGAEVFLVLDGQVNMRYREGGLEQTVHLAAGDIFIAGHGDAHIAEPVGPARILVVERKGSI